MAMTHDELVAEVDRLKKKLEAEQKDHWDKAGIVGTVAGGVLVPMALAAAGFYFSNILSDQQINSNREIATNNLRLGQYQLAAGLMKSLSSPEPRERKQAINFVFIVLPESDARKLVDALSQGDPDASVRTSATEALTSRLTELAAEAVGGDPQQRARAVNHLTNSWKGDPQLTRTLLETADRQKANPAVQANAAMTLSSFEPRKLKQHSNEVAELIRRATVENVQFQGNVKMLNKKLQTRE